MNIANRPFCLDRDFPLTGRSGRQRWFVSKFCKEGFTPLQRHRLGRPNEFERVSISEFPSDVNIIDENERSISSNQSEKYA